MKNILRNSIAGSLVILAGLATAQQLSWQRTNGPRGGVVLAMVASPATSRVWSGNGFYSSDNGTTWLAKPNGLVPGSPQSHFAMAVNDAGYLFTGNFSGSYRSTDGGDNWSPMTFPSWPSPSVVSLATHGDEVWAGSYAGKIYHSVDKGTTWTVAHDSDDFVADVMAIVAFGPTVYAGTYGYGVLKSGDNGKTWTRVENGFNHSGIVSLATTDSTTMNILAGTNGSIYFTATGGASWSELINIGSTVYSVTPNPLTGTIYAATDNGIYRAAGPGGTWTTSNTGLTTPLIRSITVDKNTGYIYAGTLSDGVFRSTNNGDAWEQVGTPVAVFSLTTYQGNKILAATNDSLFTTLDAGTSWQQSNSGIPHQTSNVVYTEPSSGKIYAGSFRGMYRSDDNTVSWNSADSGITNHTFHDILSSRTGEVFAATGGGLFESTDQGSSWTLKAGLLDTVIWDSAVYAIAYDTAGYLYASKSSGLYRSDNGGDNWQLMYAQFPGNISSLSVLPNGDVLAGLSFNGIYRSTDKGLSWTQLNTSIASAVDRMIVGKSGAVFAATIGDGVYASTDGGNTWSRPTNGLTSLNIYSLALDASEYLWAGTLDGGVFRSTISTSGVKYANDPESTVRVYPNPAVEKVIVEVIKGGALEVFDALGNKLFTHEIHQGANEIAVNDLAMGSYLLRITTENTAYTTSVVVMR